MGQESSQQNGFEKVTLNSHDCGGSLGRDDLWFIIIPSIGLYKNSMHLRIARIQ